MAPAQSWKTAKSLGERIRLLRQAKKLPQRALLPFSVKQSYLANLETGGIENPSVEMISNIARGLGITAKDLVAGTVFEQRFQAEDLPHKAYCPSNRCKKLALNRYRTGMIIPHRFSIERMHVGGKAVYEARFCPFCGTKLVSACPSCKKPIVIDDPEQTNCIHCGERIFKQLLKEEIDAIENRKELP